MSKITFNFKKFSFVIILPIFFISIFFLPSTVHAAYRDTIEADTPLYYWPMDEASGTTLTAAVGGTAINLTGATVGQAGKVDGTAVSFNGTSNSAQTASSLDLTTHNKIVVEALVYIPSYTNNGRTVWEFSPNVTNTPPDTFMFNVDGGVSGSEATSNVALQGNGGYSIATYTRPTAGTWHHIVTVYNKGLSSNEVDFYIDGVLQSATRPYNTNNTNYFGNRVLYLMARNASSNFTQGKIQHLAIYSDLSEARILAHANLINTASAITLDGPTTGLYSASSAPFTIGANGTLTGSVTVTPNDGGLSGVFNPTSATISSSTPTATFTYYPITTGARDISVTNDGGLTNPSPISYQVVAPATAVTLSGPTAGSNGIATSNYTVGTDNLVSSDVVVTPNDNGAGGAFTPSSITITTINTTGTFTYTPASVGSKTISVTNDGGLTNPSSIILVVSAAPAYQSTIQAEGTLLNYWPMTESSGTSLTALAGGVNINLNGATVGVSGKVGGTAVSFNGTSNSAQTASAINLTAYNKIVVEALLYFPSYDGTYRQAWESGPSAISTGFGFTYDGGTGGGIESNVFLNGDAGYNLALYTRPSVANWHHVVTVYNKGLASNEVDFYIDGVLQAVSSRPFNSNNTNYFGDNILYLMSRAGNSYYGAGKMQHLAMYSDLSEARILAHANLINTASIITLTGPTSGINGSVSSNFSVSSDLPVTSSIIVTPNDNSAGGVFIPTTVTISSGTPTATFTYTPASVGSKTISVTNDGGLSDPTPITYTVTPNTPATAVSIIGPVGGSVNTSSTNFTVSADGIITGSLIITPGDNGEGGTFTPPTVTISSGTPTATFTYTPISLGIKNISITNNQSLSNSSSINYSVIMVGTGLVLGDSTVATYAGGTQIASFIYTTEQVSDGWQVTNIAVPGHTIAQQKSVYLTTGNRSTVDYTISQIGLNDLNPAEASSVAIARLQDLINTINSNKKVGAKVIISAMNPCKQRLIDIYGATNGLISQQKWVDINEAIKGNGPTPITGVDYRVSNHVALLDDGAGNLNPIYDTGDHIHENNAARQIIARVWRDSLAELGLLTPDVPSAPIIGTATAGDNLAVVTFSQPQFNGGSTIIGYTITASPTGGTDANAGSTNLSHTITGLTYGTSYTFTVTSANTVGTSDASSASNSITPVDTTNPTVNAGVDENKSAEFTKVATASDSGSGVNVATYQWAKISGPGTLTFGTDTALNTTISADTDGTYVISFTASDNAGNSNSDNFTLIWNTAPTTYTITPSNGSHGSISPSGVTTVNSGANQSFSITADSGYHIADVLVDGSSVGAISAYEFSNVFADHTISATFAVTSSGGGGCHGCYVNPSVPYGGFKMSINGGVSTTTNRNVFLGFNAGVDIRKIAISMTGDFTDASQENYTASKQWDLCSKLGGAIKNLTCPNGIYKVYAKFYTAYGKTSDTSIASSTITLKTNAIEIENLQNIKLPFSNPFTKYLQYRQTNNDIKRLQILLNSDPDTKIADTGAGSSGKETNYFGLLTYKAVIKFQNKYAKDILAPWGFVKGTGYVGKTTLSKLNELIGKSQ